MRNAVDNAGRFLGTLPDGSCGFGELDPRLYPFWGIGAVQDRELQQRHPLAGCGACFQVRCVDAPERCSPTNAGVQSVIMTVTSERCDSCSRDGDVLLHVFSFEQLGRFQQQQLDVEYRQINCQPPDGVTVAVRDYESAQGRLRLALLNVACENALQSVRLQGSSGGQTAEMRRAYGAVWEVDGVTSSTLPASLQLSFADGATLMLPDVITDDILQGRRFAGTGMQKQCDPTAVGGPTTVRLSSNFVLSSDSQP